jgi:O-succinylbenzoic acid--CoA ligase
VEVPATRVAELLPAVQEALTAQGPALLPVPDGEPGQALLAAARVEEPVDEAVALVLPTSGSTGAPHLVELSAAALVASANATHDRLGGPGAWLLALPLTHVAGWQVLVRSAVAGAPLSTMPAGPFTPAAFIEAADRLRHKGPRYASLVPTQLARLLDDPAATEAVASLDGVLVGGAATSSALLDRARAAGVTVHTTYGMTETSGGCVYDGRPLAGVQVTVERDRIMIAGDVLAERYRDDDALTRTSFVTRDGARWFRTSDRGALRDDGTLAVLGRADDVIVSGGANVSPSAVEDVISRLDGVQAVLVVGVPDAEWGQAVVALIEGAATEQQVRTAVAATLGRECAPRHVVHVEHLPLRGIGKPDRLAGARIALERLA